MKRFALYLMSLLIAFAPFLSVQKAIALGPNLIQNPSAETQNPNNAALPTNWAKDQWGTSTRTLTYDKASTAQDGTKSLYAEIKTYTNGDIKWSHKQVTVTPNTSYTFSDYYKANVSSQLVVQTQSTTGALTYQSLKLPLAAANWTFTTAAFTTSSTAKAVRVFHVINKVGWIYTDNYYLGLTNGTVTPPTPTNPTVNLTSPVANATISGVTAVSANASDSAGIAGVQFKLDNVNLGAEDTSAPYSVNWDSKTSSNGAHSLTAVARSTSGTSTLSGAINVNVNNVPAPSIAITSPAVNSTVSSQITISASATNTVGVQYKLDNVNLGAEITNSPYSYSWDTTTVPNGSHTLTAVARNSANQTVTSAPISFTVNNVAIPPVPITNLITNPSMESSELATNKPLGWLNGSWGVNTPIYSYDTTGRTGARSVKTQITTFVSGDAKWYFEPVDVAAGSQYEYSHYYKSTSSTDVVAQFTDANGANTYQYLATVAPSTSWQLFSNRITIPASAKKMTIMHVLYSVGTLQLDDASLVLYTPPAPDTAIVKNGSFETPSANNPTTLPEGWQTGGWGSNTAFYEYLNEAYSGARSVKLTLSNYVDGDAKWFFTPVSTLASGNMYRFSTHYKTNTIPKAVAQFERVDGSTLYFGMPNPQPNGSSDWQYYSDTFTVPENVKSVTVFFLLNSNGYVQLDDESIAEYTPVGFNRPLLSLTFDDGFEDNNQTVLPMTGAYGFKTTQCYATQFVQENSTNPQLVLDFKNAGHEICSHTISHPFLTSLNSTQLETELRDSQAYLASVIGGVVPNFASPYGDYNASVNNVIKQYYRSHRTVDEGFNSKDNFDIYRIRVQNILSTTTATQVQSWLAQAQATNTWLVLVYHKVGTTGIGQFDSYQADFAAHLQAISNSGITVKTYGAALDEVTAQL